MRGSTPFFFIQTAYSESETTSPPLHSPYGGENMPQTFLESKNTLHSEEFSGSGSSTTGHTCVRSTKGSWVSRFFVHDMINSRVHPYATPRRMSLHCMVIVMTVMLLIVRTVASRITAANRDCVLWGRICTSESCRSQIIGGLVSLVLSEFRCHSSNNNSIVHFTCTP